MLVLPLASCVTLGELLNLSNLQSSHLWNGNDNCTYLVHQVIVRLKWSHVSEVSSAVFGMSVFTWTYIIKSDSS